jgi:SRSO17 transposase
MLAQLPPDTQDRLETFFAEIGTILRHKKKRASFAMYALGLLGTGERKSFEPIAMQFCTEPEQADAMHQRVQHFVTDADWSDRDVRRAAAKHAIAAMTERSPVRAWIIDDTGFIKQGSHSVGVQRQYTGTAGKVTNCQIGVSLVVANDEMHVPIDFDLYLPECWANDAERRAEAKIPDEVRFRTKPEIALDMIQRAALDRLPGDIILADAAYGESADFRAYVRLIGFDYAVGVQKNLTAWVLDSAERRRDAPMALSQIAAQLGPGRFRRVTWRDGTKAALSSRFAFARVKLPRRDNLEPETHEAEWLVVEWPEGEAEPTKYFLTTLGRRLSKKQIVRLIKERYRTERAYQELKGELGLDHFEGRRYRGWQHHVSVALACYAFVIGERVRAFPPGAEGAHDDDEIDDAA